MDKIEEEGEGENSKQKMTEAQRDRYIRKKGVTKHIILIRHGQYDESQKVSVAKYFYKMLFGRIWALD